MSEVITLSTEAFEKVAVGRVLLIDFFATWCGPCKKFAPVLEEIAAEVPEGVVVAKVDVSQEPQLAAKFSVQSVPTVLLVKDGQLVRTFVGVQEKNTLLAAIRNA